MHAQTLPMAQRTSSDLVKCNIPAAHSLAHGVLALWQCCFSGQHVPANQKSSLPQGREGCCLLGKSLTHPVTSGQLDLAFLWHILQDTEQISWVRVLARFTVAADVTQAGLPFWDQVVTGTEYPATSDCGLFPVLPTQGKEGRNNHLRAHSWQRCPACGVAGRVSHSILHPDGGKTGHVLGEHLPWGQSNARLRHFVTHQKQLPGSQEQSTPAHQLSIHTHCPSQHGQIS